MEEISIEDLASYLKEAKKQQQPNPIFFLGAGASISGGIPLARGIEEIIQSEYSNNPKVSKLDKKDITYTKLMACLTPAQRNNLLDELIKKAKINVTHIYLAQLIKNDFIDYVLTVNFDNLILRALALFDVFPPIYDLTTIGKFTTSKPKEKSVLYLHGRHQGVWLLNTEAEMETVKDIVPKIFSEIKERPWIFLGYSGNDPIFEHIQEIGRFDNNMYWVGYNNSLPSKKVQSFLGTSNVEAHFISGYDADAFMLKLNNELGLPQPDILDKPFSSLKKMLSNIVDIDEEDHFRGVKSRLEIARKSIETAIVIFENMVPLQFDRSELAIDKLKKEVVDLIISKDFEANKISEIESLSKHYKDKKTNTLLSELYFHIAHQDSKIAAQKEMNNPTEAEFLYQKAIEKLQEALFINPDTYSLLVSLAILLGKLASIKPDDEAETLYPQAIEKLQEASVIKNSSNELFISWGNILGGLASIKPDDEAENLYQQAIDKYEEAFAIKSDSYELFMSWGVILSNLASIKPDDEAEDLYKEAFDKYREALIIKPDGYNVLINWSSDLRKLASIKPDDEAEDLYKEAFDKLQEASDIKQGDFKLLLNWGNTLYSFASTKSEAEAENLYQQAVDKYEEAFAVKSDSYELLVNWSVALNHLASTKSESEAENLYQQAIDNCKEALVIKPNNYELLFDWANILNKIALLKSGAEAGNLYQQAIDKYEEASKIEPDNYKLLFNWASVLNNFALLNTGAEAENLYQQAIDKYEEASKIEPVTYELSANLGICMSNFALLKSESEAENLYQQAIDKYEEAFAIKPDSYELFVNWGITLNHLASTKSESEAENLYQEAFDKLQEASDLKPDDYSVFGYWSSVTMNLSKIKTEVESRRILNEGLARAKLFHKHYGQNYNLSCYYALMKEKPNALRFLELSLQNKEVSKGFVLKDEDWKEFLNEKDFKTIIKNAS